MHEQTGEGYAAHQNDQNDAVHGVFDILLFVIEPGPDDPGIVLGVVGQNLHLVHASNRAKLIPPVIFGPVDGDFNRPYVREPAKLGIAVVKAVEFIDQMRPLSRVHRLVLGEQVEDLNE